MEDNFNFEDDFNFDDDYGIEENKPLPKEKEQTKRRTVECLELSTKYEYRRAFSEVKLLEAMKYERLKENTSYNFITGGDVDALSFLKIVLNEQNLDYLLFSTWCMAAEDILQIDEWIQQGKIKKMDAYLGEIFPNSYKIEYKMMQKLFDKYKCGRMAIFKNHSKIFAGYGEKYHFGIQTSANINTNPRTENGNITLSKELFEFYKSYFDGIKSFEK